MKKKTIVLIAAAALILAAVFCFIRFILSDNGAAVAEDELRLEIQLDVEENIGLFIIDRSVAGADFSGGISNADKSLLKHDELLAYNYTKEEFNNAEDLSRLKLRFSIITKYFDPNYENSYPEEYTKVMEPIIIDAKYGETYRFSVTGNAKDGYRAVIEGENENEVLYKQSAEYGEYERVPLFDCKKELAARYTPLNDGWVLDEAAAQGEAVSIMCMGDMLAEPALTRACYLDGGYDFRSCFKYVKPVIKKCDLAIANLETVIYSGAPTTNEKHTVGTRYICNAPVEFLEAIKAAGIDAVAMANNHSADGGYEGLLETIDNVEKYGFIHTGTFKDEDVKRYALIDVKGIKIALFSYSQFYNRDIHKEYFTEHGAEVMLNLFDENKVRRDAEAARKDGAEFLLCYIHMKSKEYTHEVTEAQKETAQLLADCGMDCIMGSHSHSLQRYDIISSSDGRRVPMIYSLGNFITSDNTSMICRYNVIYNIQLVKDAAGVHIHSEGFVPCRIIESDLQSAYTVFPTQKAYRENKADRILEEAEAKIARAMGGKISALNEFI